MDLWGITDRGSVRKENQDAYRAEMLSEGLALGVVCDGMGGALAGNIASQLALETFWEEVAVRCAGGGLPEDPEQALREALERSNRAVFERSLTDPDCRGMGTTLVALLCDGRRGWAIHVGDSRCYLATEGSIEQVGRDHSLVEVLLARGEITPEQARSHPRKNLITRALGVEMRVEPDVTRVDCPEEGGWFLLCSDGLSNQVTDQELLYEIVHGGASEDCCRRLLELALSRGAPDNVTAVLVEL